MSAQTQGKIANPDKTNILPKLKLVSHIKKNITKSMSLHRALEMIQITRLSTLQVILQWLS